MEVIGGDAVVVAMVAMVTMVSAAYYCREDGYRYSCRLAPQNRIGEGSQIRSVGYSPTDSGVAVVSHQYGLTKSNQRWDNSMLSYETSSHSVLT